MLSGLAKSRDGNFTGASRRGRTILRSRPGLVFRFPRVINHSAAPAAEDSRSPDSRSGARLQAMLEGLQNDHTSLRYAPNPFHAPPTDLDPGVWARDTLHENSRHDGGVKWQSKRRTRSASGT